jgi:hypothetical protein
MYVLDYEKCVTYSLYLLMVSALCRIPFCGSGHLVGPGRTEVSFSPLSALSNVRNTEPLYRRMDIAVML